MNINDLPDDILGYIFSMLPPYPIQHVCKKWRNKNKITIESIYESYINIRALKEINHLLLCEYTPRDIIIQLGINVDIDSILLWDRDDLYDCARYTDPPLSRMTEFGSIKIFRKCNRLLNKYINNIVQYKHLDMLKLYDPKHLNSHHLYIACNTKHIEMIQYINQYVPFDENCIQSAIVLNNKYVIDQVIDQLPANCATRAADCLQFDLMMYLHSLGYQIDKRAYKHVMEACNTGEFRYLIQNNIPFTLRNELIEKYRVTINRKIENIEYAKMIKIAVINGIDFSQYIKDNINSPSIRYLHDVIPITRELYEYAKKCKNVQLVAFYRPHFK